MAKSKEKWIQGSIVKEHEGDFTEWCKRHGFKGTCQECINLAIRTGGRAARMANFAINVSHGKYHHPGVNRRVREKLTK